MSNSDIRFLDPNDRAARRDWDEAVEGMPGGTVFHTTAWMDVIRHGLGLAPRFAYLPGLSGSIRALVPLFQAGGWIRSVRWLNLPQSCSSDPLATDAAEAVNLLEQVASAAAIQGAAAVVLRTPRRLEPSAPAGWEVRHEQTLLRHVLNLAGAKDIRSLPGIQDSQRKTFRVVRNRLEASGAKIGLVGPDETGFFARAVHRIVLSRHNHMGMPASFFAALLEFLPSAARLAVVCPETGPVLAYTVQLMNSNFGHLLYGSGLPTRQGTEAYRYCVGSEIEAAIRAGLRSLDFGETHPEHQGLVYFKETWGAQRVDGSYLFIARKDVPCELRVDGRGFGLARRVLPYIPAGLSLRIAGPVHRALQ